MLAGAADPQHLLDEQRVALGDAVELVGAGGARAIGEPGGDVAWAEAAEGEHVALAAEPRQRVGELGRRAGLELARGGEEQDRRGLDLPRHEQEQEQRGEVSGVEIFEQEQQGLAPRGRLERTSHVVEEPKPLLAGVLAEGRRERLERAPPSPRKIWTQGQ